jgi:hypothetical protein
MLFKSQVYTQVSGSVGGVTYARNRTGMYARSRALPVNPGTSFQNDVRNWFGQMASYWGLTLTADERASWNNYAANVPVINRLGDAINLTGQSWFIGSAVSRLQAGLAVVESGPTIYQRAHPIGIPTFAIDASDDDVDFAFDNSAEWAGLGGAAVLFASRPQPASVNFFAGPYRYAGVVLGAAIAPTSPATIELPFPVQENDKVFFQVRYLDPDGATSVPFRYAGVAAA